MNKQRFFSFSPILVLLLYISCSTAYQRSGWKGGFSDKQIRHNEFSLLVSINGYTSWETMIDYAILRSSELSLENGYAYFMLLNEKTYNVISRTEYEELRNQKDHYKGVTRPVVRMFRKKPIYGNDFYYDALEEYTKLAKKLDLKDLLERKFPTGIQGSEPTSLSDHIYYRKEKLDIVPVSSKTEIKYYGIEENLQDRAILIGNYWDAERPIADLNKFKELLVKDIKEPRVNTIKIIEDINMPLNPHVTAYRQYSVANQFIAQFYCRPAYYLGLKFEPGKLDVNEYIVRGFYENSAAKHLKLDDKILRINGNDVLQYQKIISDWFTWNKDSKVKLEIIRSGNAIQITVPVFENP